MYIIIYMYNAITSTNSKFISKISLLIQKSSNYIGLMISLMVELKFVLFEISIQYGITFPCTQEPEVSLFRINNNKPEVAANMPAVINPKAGSFFDENIDPSSSLR